MVDGVYPESAPMGDPGFLAHGRIDPSAAAPQDARDGSSALGEPTRELARALGYDLGSDRSAGSTARERARSAAGASRRKAGLR